MNTLTMGTPLPQGKSIFGSSYGSRPHVGFRRVTTQHPCPVCGGKKWCQVTQDGRLAHCMREACGAIKQAKDDGYIHVLIHDDTLAMSVTRNANAFDRNRNLKTELAPLEIRDAVYSKLLELSPAWKYERELVTAPDGLLARGFAADDVMRFGALPACVNERDALAHRVNQIVADELPLYATTRGGVTVLGVPGFWEGTGGIPKLGRPTKYRSPVLTVPYRDERGNIQACQLRFPFVGKTKSSYVWLSTAEDKLDKEPRGTSSGSPLHFALRAGSYINDLPILITEGALKAEAFVALRPTMRAIATAGVGVAHTEIIAATRGRDTIIAFDSDHRQNKNVCRQLAKLVAERAVDARRIESNASTGIVVWEGAKGIDDAVLANLHLRVLDAAAWFQNLPNESAEEVSVVWQNYGFAPDAEASPNDGQEKKA
ncbi:MAG: DUF3854 domain-containing protein [Pyrinomonadaceae bacterium MAG19_C2-C3]|nr:DUF3854 domain-containing protein [Pyrinomonadaceae bacterium MAG19_C2-C3]